MKQALILALVAVAITTTASAQSFKMTTPFGPGVAVPDKIESSIGILKLDYGYPSADTVEKIYDNRDRSRALQAYLLAIPIANDREGSIFPVQGRLSVGGFRSLPGAEGKRTSMWANNRPETVGREPGRGLWRSHSAELAGTAGNMKFGLAGASSLK